jgi:chemotaxis protein methyltransferase CheR
MDIPAITDKEFSQFQKLIHDIAGIHMNPIKKPLVMGRLAKRLIHHGLRSYGEYFKLLDSGEHPKELQTAVDLLTTNETYFFREPKHFEFLQQKILTLHARGKNFRVWSAACSTGQEPYSIAMTLSHVLGDNPWEVIASDLSTRVLEKARTGHYSLEQADNIPKEYLAKFCLKGIGSQAGTFLIDKAVRNRVKFAQINLNERLPRGEMMDLIFLRNVMIYFNAETKHQVVQRVVETLRPGGHLFVGHSESLNGLYDKLKAIAPAIYRKE